MQERLQEILKRERLTPARFAELVGVQRSSVSHILSGRNKPSLEFLRKIMASLEHISPDWLISGVGPYKRAEMANFNRKASFSESSNHTEGTIKFPSLTNSSKESESAGGKNSLEGDTSRREKTTDTEEAVPKKVNPSEAKEGDESNSATSSTDRKKQVVKTILFYDDQTFEVFYPL
ncbi:helix-turn-helix transcriptional regulator [Marinilabilia sp.]